MVPTSKKSEKTKGTKLSTLNVKITKVTLVFLSLHSLVPKIEICLKYFRSKKIKSSHCVWRVASYICLFRYILCVATLGLSYTGTKETKHPKQMHPPFFTVFLTIHHAEQNISLPCMHYRTLFSKVSFCINCWITFLFLHLHSQFGGMNLCFWRIERYVL